MAVVVRLGACRKKSVKKGCILFERKEKRRNFAFEKEKINTSITPKSKMKKLALLSLAGILACLNIGAEPIIKGETRQIAEKRINQKRPATKSETDSGQMMKTDVVLDANDGGGNPYVLAVTVDTNGNIVSNRKGAFTSSALFEVELTGNNIKGQYSIGEDVNFTLNYKMCTGKIENGLLMSVALPIKYDESGKRVEDRSRKEARSMIPIVVNAKAGDEITLMGSLSADELEVGRYFLVCGGMTGLLPTDLEFEVAEAAPTGIGKMAVDDDQNAGWYDTQGRRMPQKPTTPGIYVRNGKKFVLK